MHHLLSSALQRDMLRGFTLTQPWASLVAGGAKHNETRDWYTSYRGLLAIHAAKTFPWVGEYRCVDPLSGDELTSTVDVQWVAESDGIPVNWWMVTTQASISAESHSGRDEGGTTT